MIKIYTDAAVQGNPGRAAIGIIFQKQKEQTLVKKVLQEQMDNHRAELEAIYEALGIIIHQQQQNEIIFLYSDSKVAIQAIQKNYTRQDAYRPILEKVHQRLEVFPTIFLEWIPEKENRGADQLAKQALRSANR